MREINPDLTPWEIRDIIRQTSHPIETDKPIGALLDAENAARVAKGLEPLPYSEPTLPEDAPQPTVCGNMPHGGQHGLQVLLLVPLLILIRKKNRPNDNLPLF
jgi:hypothetical protein